MINRFELFVNLVSEKFPDNFILGTSTSAFQIEGAGETEWKGFIGTGGTLLDLAIDHL